MTIAREMGLGSAEDPELAAYAQTRRMGADENRLALLSLVPNPAAVVVRLDCAAGC